MKASHALPLRVVPFRGFGNGQTICVSGRVALGPTPEPRGPHEDRPGRGLVATLGRVARLALSPRVPEARVRVRCAGTDRVLETDRHGYFSGCLELGRAPQGSPWTEYRVELLAPEPAEPVAAQGEVLRAPETARMLVVSDIDDTVMYTGVSNKLRMLWRLFAQEADERVPFPGVDELYRGLHAGSGGDESNPIVYVSRSPWSIYPTLDEFFQSHRIPVGPVLQLRDWGISPRHPFPKRAESHKRDLVESLLEVYADLHAILLGDSGQHDPEVYAALAREHPGRIAAIYIRDLEQSRERTRALEALARELEAVGVPMLAASDTEAIAADAVHRGWLPAHEPAAVHDDAARVAR